MPTIHLPIGGSSFDRTINCPAWIKKSENIPRRPAGQAAIDGSMHHEVQELCQKDAITPEDVLIRGLSYTEDGARRDYCTDDLDLANIAYDATNALLDELDIDELEIEPFVQLIVGEAGGSIDLLGLSADERTVLVLDYKFGRHPVNAKENNQLKFYGLCAREDERTRDLFAKAKNIVYAIIQPQVKGVVSQYSYTISDLDEFHEKALLAIGATKKDTPTVVPGKHCKYCPAEPYCEAKRTRVMATNLLGARLQEDLQAAADIVEEVEDWVKSIHEEMYLQMNRGVPLTGWKIVEKRPSVKWIDADAARAFFKEKRVTARDITNPAALRTPKQVQDYLKKKGRDLDLSEFIVSKSSGTTLAPEGDSREAVVVSDVQGHLKEIMK